MIDRPMTVQELIDVLQRFANADKLRMSLVPGYMTGVGRVVEQQGRVIILPYPEK